MANIQDVLAALRNADAAGDVESARRLAQIASQISASSLPAPAPAPAPQEEVGMLRRAADVPVLVGQGFATGFRLVADAFGANNKFSQAIRGVEDYLGELASAEAQGNQQRMAEVLEEASDKGVLEQVKIGLRAVGEAPLELISQAFGTIGATAVAGAAGKILGTGVAVARGAGAARALQAGARGQTVAGGVAGLGMGLGVGKGAIYEAVREELLTLPGMTEEQAEKTAQEAQSYGGENLDQILLAGGLGVASALVGADPRLASAISNRVLRKVGDRAAKEAGEQVAARTPGLLGSALRGGATEFATEFPQGAQEQLAANIALQREGFDVPTLGGVIAGGVVEGIAGAGVGAGVGAATRPTAPRAAIPLEDTPDVDPADLEIPDVDTSDIDATDIDPDDVDTDTEQVATLPANLISEEDIAALGESIPTGAMPFVRRSVIGKTREELALFAEENPEVVQSESPTGRVIRGLLAQPSVVPQATIPTAITETPSGTTTPQAIETEAQRPQSTPGQIVLQNRNRSAPASITQMQEIASKPDYGRMGFSRDFANGAPVVFGGAIPETQLGVEEVAIATDGQRIPVRYAVMNANEVLASNRVDGGVNQEYATATDRTRAIAGNGRIAGIQTAHQRGTTGDYVRDLKADARLHGIDSSVVDSVENPVLVRIMPEQFVTPDIGDVSNIPTGLELSPTEKARNDQRRVDLGVLQFAEDGSITPDTVMQFVRSMPKTEQGGLINPNGQPSSLAYDRLRNAIFARAYNDDQLIGLYAQTEDADARNVLSALAQVAGKMARLEGAGDFDIRNIVTDAAKIAVNARINKMPLARVAQQVDIAADPDVQAILELFAANNRRVKVVVERLGTLADRAFNEFTKPAEDFFGEVPKRTRGDIVGELRTENEQARQQAVEEQDRRRAAQEDDVRQAPESTGAEATPATPSEELTLTPPSAEAQAEAERRAEEAAKAEEEATKEAAKTEAEAKVERERKEIEQRSAGAAGAFQLGQDAEANLTGQKDIVDTPVQISPEQEKKQALDTFESAISKTTPRFKALKANKRSSLISPKALTAAQVRSIKELASEAIDLGMPASLLNQVQSSGATGMASIAAMSNNGFLLLGKEWAGSSKAAKLQTIIHEMGHAADTMLDDPSGKADWARATKELRQWHDASDTPGKHPLAYPFAPQFKNKVRVDKETFAQAFSFYFTSPADLQVNAPEAYSQIQSIVERIQNESQPASAASAATTGTTGVQVQPSRTPEGRAVQPRTGEVGAGVGRAERVQDRGAEQVAEKSVLGLSMAYHAGDLQYGRDTTLGRMMGGRSTGHFGTGVYFVSDPSLISGRQDRPVQAVDLSEYNLARPSSPESAKRLHDSLRTVNRMKEAADVDTRDGAIAIENMSSVLGVSSENEIRSAMKEAVAEAAELRPTYAFENDYIDSASTRLMKKLGYDGVDNRGLKGFDNTDFGTVVYAEQISPDDQEINLMMSTEVGESGSAVNQVERAKAESERRAENAMPIADPDAAKGKEAKDAVKASRKSIMHKNVDATWDLNNVKKELGLSDSFFYSWIDKQIDLKRVVEAIQATGEKIKSKFNALERERLYHGRVAERTKSYLKEDLKPTLNLMTKFGISQTDIGEFLLNRHVPEANAQIAARNERFADPDKPGTTIKTADAIAYMNNLDPKRKRQLEAVAKRMDATLDKMQVVLVESGLESKETIAGWRDMFKFYVPLVRENADFSVNEILSQGSGLSQSGPVSKSRTGSEKAILVDQIFSSIAMQHERMILKAERNRVGQSLFGLALTYSNPGFWLALDPETNVIFKTIQDLEQIKADRKAVKEVLDAGGLSPEVQVEYELELDMYNKIIKKKSQPARAAYAKARDDLMEMGYTEAEATTLVEQIMMPPMKARFDKVQNKVVYEPNAAFSNKHVFVTRINGSNKFVLFNAKDERASRMVTSLKSMDAEQLGNVMQVSAAVTRYFSAINTQYNPVFGVYNFLRDMQTATLQLGRTEIADSKGAVMKGTLPAMMAIFSEARATRRGEKVDAEAMKDLLEFRREGGQTGFRDMYSQSEQRARAIQREIDPASWADSNLANLFTANGTLKVPFETMRKGAAPLFNLLTDYNSAMENAVRLSAYVVARNKLTGQGIDVETARQRAAVIAKEITVNFNQKGQMAVKMGALYSFFNASAQGTYFMAKALSGPTGRKIIGGAFLLGSIQAVMLALAGFDDDEPREFVKSRNYIIPTGNGKYIAFPMPLGFNVLPSISRIATEWVLSGGENTPKKALDLLDVVMDMYNPIGHAGLSGQTLAPTLLDPLVALAENKDWTGKDIARKDFSGLNPTPGYTRSKESSTVLGQEVARFLNFVSGGTENRPGIVNPTADQLEYLVGQVTGGVGRELTKSVKAIEATLTGEELPSYNVPLVGRFYGNVNQNAAVAGAFYRNLTELNIHKREIETLRKDRGNVQEYLRKNPEARLSQMGQTQYRQVQRLRKLRREMLQRGDNDQAKRVEEQIADRMRRLNERYRDLSK